MDDGSVCYMIYDPDSESCASGYSDDEFFLTKAEAKSAVSGKEGENQ